MAVVRAAWQKRAASHRDFALRREREAVRSPDGLPAAAGGARSAFPRSKSAPWRTAPRGPHQKPRLRSEETKSSACTGRVSPSTYIELRALRRPWWTDERRRRRPAEDSRGSAGSLADAPGAPSSSQRDPPGDPDMAAEVPTWRRLAWPVLLIRLRAKSSRERERENQPSETRGPSAAQVMPLHRARRMRT